MPRKGAIAAKTAARKRAGVREPSATVVTAAEMCATEAVATAAEVTTTMASAMTATAAVAAAASADRHAGQQGTQNNDRNSEGRFEHGSLLRPPRSFWGT